MLVAAREKTLDLVAYNNPGADLLDETPSAAIPAQADGRSAAATA
ncbi:hypothetical protein ACWEQL_04070 [Kitasatospora sp. NPDC004240]